jgi:hypothetical protein
MVGPSTAWAISCKIVSSFAPPRSRSSMRIRGRDELPKNVQPAAVARELGETQQPAFALDCHVVVFGHRAVSLSPVSVAAGVNSPLANGAFLVCPTQLRQELLFPHDRTTALPARLAVEVFASLADSEPAGHLFLACLRGTGGNVPSGGGGEVGGLLEQRHALRILTSDTVKVCFLELMCVSETAVAAAITASTYPGLRLGATAWSLAREMLFMAGRRLVRKLRSRLSLRLSYDLVAPQDRCAHGNATTVLPPAPGMGTARKKLSETSSISVFHVPSPL